MTFMPPTVPIGTRLAEFSQPQVLMLGKGWFPAEIGGLDRYYRGLLVAMPAARGVVIGPADDAPPRVAVVSRHDTELAQRLGSFAIAAARARRSADLIDVHFALYGVLPVVLFMFSRKPLVVHFHGPWADESLAAGESADWRIKLKRAVERVVYRRADFVVTLTAAFKEVLVIQYGLTPSRILVLRPGVDTDEFQPGDPAEARAAFGIPEDAFLVCCARRLVPRMGIEVLLDAWQIALARDPKAYLLIVGEGPLEAALRQRASETVFKSRVHVTGRVSDSSLRTLYRGADLNVIPSLAFEGFGLTVLEAAASGTPSIVTNVGGLPEAVEGLAGDLVLSADSAQALAQRLSDARDGRLPTRSETRDWALGQSWTRTAEAHMREYEALIRRKARAGTAANAPTSSNLPRS